MSEEKEVRAIVIDTEGFQVDIDSIMYLKDVIPHLKKSKGNE